MHHTQGRDPFCSWCLGRKREPLCLQDTLQHSSFATGTWIRMRSANTLLHLGRRFCLRNRHSSLDWSCHLFTPWEKWEVDWVPQTPPFITEFTRCFFFPWCSFSSQQSLWIFHFSFRFIFIIFKLYVSVGVCVWVYACEYRFLWRLEEDIEPIGAWFIYSCRSWELNLVLCKNRMYCNL